MKTRILLAGLAASLLLLSGCVVAPSPYGYGPGYGYAPGYYYAPVVDVGVGWGGGWGGGGWGRGDYGRGGWHGR